MHYLNWTEMKAVFKHLNSFNGCQTWAFYNFCLSSDLFYLYFLPVQCLIQPEHEVLCLKPASLLLIIFIWSMYYYFKDADKNTNLYKNKSAILFIL